MNNLLICFLSAALAATLVGAVCLHLFQRERERLILGQSFPLWGFMAAIPSLKGAFIRKLHFFGNEEVGEIREVKVYSSQNNRGHIEFVCDWIGSRRDPLSEFKKCAYTHKAVTIGLENLCVTAFPYNDGTMFCLASPGRHEVVMIDPGRWNPCVEPENLVAEDVEALPQPA